MSRPTISVVVTCFNAAWCIERLLDSVMAQTLPADEVLISDDGSTDDTVERILERYGDGVSVLRLPHQGLTLSRRAALAAAGSEWVALADADDVWAPPKLERQLCFLEHHPEVRWLVTDGEFVAAEGMLRESWLSDYFERVSDQVGDLYPPLLERCFPLVSSSLIHAESYRAVGGFDPEIRFSQDYDLWLRLAARFPGGMMAERLVQYYSSPHQMSRRIEERHRDDLRLMRRAARGEYRPDRRLQAVAARRAAALEFDLGVTCLRSGRKREGRVRLMRAATSPGPLRRRGLAALGALAPSWALPRLMHSEWVKGTVRRARRQPPRMDLPMDQGTSP